MIASPIADRRAGAIMQTVAVFGVAVAAFVSVVAWRFVGDLDRNIDQSLAIGEDAAATLSETIDVADDVIESLDEGLGTLAATLQAVDTTLTNTSDLASTTASLAASLPTSFDDIDAALVTVESLSGAIDAALRGASRIPLGPDYDPAVPLPEAVGNLRAAFEPIGGDLTAIAIELSAFSAGSIEVRDGLVSVRTDVTRTRSALADSASLLDQYRDTADRAGLLASSSRDDLRSSFGWARVAIVLLGVLIAVSQFVPWWLGTRARAGVPAPRPHDADLPELERVA